MAVVVEKLIWVFLLMKCGKIFTNLQTKRACQMVRSLVDFANNFHFLVRFLQINLHISEKMSNFGTPLPCGRVPSELTARQCRTFTQCFAKKNEAALPFFSAITPILVQAQTGALSLKNAVNCNFSSRIFANVHFFS